MKMFDCERSKQVPLIITFDIRVPLSPVVQIHVNICAEIWSAAGQRTEHFVLIQTCILPNMTLKTNASQTRPRSQPEPVMLIKHHDIWLICVLLLMHERGNWSWCMRTGSLESISHACFCLYVFACKSLTSGSFNGWAWKSFQRLHATHVFYKTPCNRWITRIVLSII